MRLIDGPQSLTEMQEEVELKRAKRTERSPWLLYYLPNSFVAIGAQKVRDDDWWMPD